MSEIKLEQLQEHKKPDDAWIVIHGSVYDVTEFLATHPGGADNLMKGVELNDATELFTEVHSHVEYDKILKDKFIGRLS